MSLIINHNISALNTQRQLNSTSRNLSKSLEKLSSGYKINVASDDPSGLIISEQLRSQNNGLERAIRNSQEASNVIGITEGSLIEMNEILRKLRSLALHAANSGVTAPDQVQADQQEVDSSIQTIDRIANTTRYSDQYLLNGSKGLVFERNTVVDDSMDHPLLDVDNTRIDQVFKRDGSAMNISFSGIKAADQANYEVEARRAVFEADPQHAGTQITAAKTDEDQQFIITGTRGSRQFNFAAGTDLGSIVESINNTTDSIGVGATLIFDSAVVPSATTTAFAGGARAFGNLQVYNADIGSGAAKVASASILPAAITANRFIVGKNLDGHGRIHVEATVVGAGAPSLSFYKDADKKVLLGTGASGTFTPASGSGLLGGDITVNLTAANVKDGDTYILGLVGQQDVGAAGVNTATDGIDITSMGMTGLGTANTMDTNSVVSGVELGSNTDANGNLYFKSEGPNTARIISVYNDSEMKEKQLVARGTANLSAANSITLESVTMDNGEESNLGITLNFGAASATNVTETGSIKCDEQGMRLYSADYGEREYIRMQNLKGTMWGAYQEPDNATLELVEIGVTNQQIGSDATITMNGSTLGTTGLEATVTTQDYSGELNFNEGKLGETTIAQQGYTQGSLFSRASALQTVADNATATLVNTFSYATNARSSTSEKVDEFIGGMQYQLGGGEGDQERTVYGIPSMAAANIGKINIGGEDYSLQDVLGGGRASLSKEPIIALQVVTQAVSDVSSLRARLGAFQKNMLQTNINSLEVAVQNITLTESAIRDANMAVETTEFTKNQILLQAGTAMLAQANTASQNILQLLG